MLGYTLLVFIAVVQPGMSVYYKCERGWSLFQDHCYLINNDAWFTWANANNYCTRLDADLLSVSSEEEETFIHEYAQSDDPSGRLWIGLNDLNVEGNFEWSDETVVRYTKWEPLQPNDSGDCVILRIFDNNWNDIPCGTLLGAYCKKKATEVHYKCEPGWSLFQDHCYLINNDARFTWVNANNYCTRLDADLLSVSSEEEETFIHDHAQLYDPRGRLWIGLNDLNVEGNFEWSDETVVGYTKWEPFQPNDSGNCVILRIIDNNWNDIPCGTLLGAYCKKKATEA